MRLGILGWPRGLMREFRGFAFKGNMIDLAVAVVIGTTFKSVMDSLVKNVVMPALSYIVPTEGGYRAWRVGNIEIGLFLGELVNFLIIAAAVFVFAVKLMGMLRKKPAPEASSRLCPICDESISLKAKRCPHCTSELSVAA